VKVATDRLELLRRLIVTGGGDSEAASWAAGALRVWLASNGELDLPRCFGLPSSAKRVRTMLRDVWINEAARYIDEPTLWKKAVALAAEIKRFETRLWPCWKSGKLPPQRATPVEACLFFARQHDALPGTARQVRNILAW
jgi:hypothetical protein